MKKIKIRLPRVFAKDCFFSLKKNPVCPVAHMLTAIGIPKVDRHTDFSYTIEDWVEKLASKVSQYGYLEMDAHHDLCSLIFDVDETNQWKEIISLTDIFLKKYEKAFEIERIK